MKKLLSFGVGLFIGMTALTLFGSQDRDGNEGVKDRFVGAWRLASLEGQGADGKFTGRTYHERHTHRKRNCRASSP